uniref:Dynein assembly factor with WDR repeat domains 1 n=1 Tax=Leptobrachium leishanense TaxID=445787 RepID=A0A8C5QRK1_9ANUR
MGTSLHGVKIKKKCCSFRREFGPKQVVAHPSTFAKYLVDVNFVFCFSHRDKIATGSFDKTCKLWSAETGMCYHTFRGHTAEIVCLAFNPQSTLVATGSMDTTAKLWDIQSGEEALNLTGHSAEIISLSFNTTGDRLITGSFDHTVALWDIPTGRKVHTLIGHRGEISSAQFNWDCSLIATASMDKSCRVLLEYTVHPARNAWQSLKATKERFQSYLMIYGRCLPAGLTCAMDGATVHCSLILWFQSHEERGRYYSSPDCLWTSTSFASPTQFDHEIILTRSFF